MDWVNVLVTELARQILHTPNFTSQIPFPITPSKNEEQLHKLDGLTWPGGKSELASALTYQLSSTALYVIEMKLHLPKSS